MKVSFDHGSGLLERFWIDCNRGGHPLKAEFFQNDQRTILCKDIVLKKVAIDTTESVWIPISGAVETFQWTDGLHEDPIYREHYHILDQSISMNTPKIQKHFVMESILDRYPEVKRMSKDPRRFGPRGRATLESRLSAHISESEESSKLVADLEEKNWWSDVSAASLIPTTFGVLCFFAAYLLNRRRS
jgi:hypothetical protein